MASAGGLVVRTSRVLASSLLIGIGNPLRGDDGVAPWLVQAWARRRAWREAAVGAADGEGGIQPTGLRVLVVGQLLPELADELAAVRRVLFVDAWRVDPGAALGGRTSQAGSQDARTSGCDPQEPGPLGGDSQGSAWSGPRLLPIAAADRWRADAAGWGAAGWTPGHQLTPPVLLQLSAGLYGRTPAAHSLLIPAMAFATTDPSGGPRCFSAGLCINLPRAWQLLDQWLQQGGYDAGASTD
jgi:hypothetical protein